MDHEVVPRLSKRCDWTLKSSRDDFGLHQGKNGRVTTEVEVHKFFFKPTLSIAMVQRVFRWDKQKRWSRKKSKGPCHKNAVLRIFGVFLMIDNIKKIQHLHFLVHGHSSWSTFDLHLVKGP
jgi:hypothetical protein